MTVKGVTFAVNLGQIINQNPEVVSEQILVNNSDQEQTMAFSFSSSLTNTSSFAYEVGFTIGASTEFTGAYFIEFSRLHFPDAHHSNPPHF